MTYHIIIQTERRTQPERMAIPIATSVPTGQTIQGPMGEMPEYVAGVVQLHTHSAAGLPANIDNPQFVMVAEWDGISPYVVCHKGNYSTRTMGYAGWPELTKEEWDALPAPDTPA
jgi:hypothetical protein